MSDAGIRHEQGQDGTLDDVITHLEARVPSANNFESRSAIGRLREIQRKLSYRIIETYDPEDKDSFSDVVIGLCDCIPDSAELAGLFGISVSTLYRWRAGEAVPHRLMRAAVKEHLIGLLRDDGLRKSLGTERPRYPLH